MEPLNNKVDAVVIEMNLIPVEENNRVDWEKIPNVAFSVLLSYCSMVDEVILSKVSRCIRHLVFQTSQRHEKYRMIREALPGSIDLSTSTVDAMDVVASKIEFVPLLGTSVSLIRATVGLIVAFGWIGPKIVSYREIINADNPAARELARVKNQIQSLKTDRAVHNFMRGCFNAIPLIGLYTCALNLNIVAFERIQAHAIQCLEGCLIYSIWASRVRTNVLPCLDIPEENLRYITSQVEILPQQDTVISHIRLWVNKFYDDNHPYFKGLPKNITDKYEALVGQARRIQEIVIGIKKELLKVTLGGHDGTLK